VIGENIELISFSKTVLLAYYTSYPQDNIFNIKRP